MNIVTKIAIVLQLVCTIVLSVFLMIVLGNAKQYKVALDDANTGRTAAVALQRAAEIKVTESANSSSKARIDADARADAATNKMNDAQSRLLIAEAAKEKSESAVQQKDENISRMTNTMNAMQARQDLDEKQLAEDRVQLPKVIKENAESSLAIEGLQTKLEQASRFIDRLKEELKQANKTTAVGPTETPGAVTLSPGFSSPVPVNGKVTQVTTSNGTTYLALSLGERDNIQKGTRFVISRGNKYVGDAIVERTTADQSVASVRPNNPMPVQVDDIVSSGQ